VGELLVVGALLDPQRQRGQGYQTTTHRKQYALSTVVSGAFGVCSTGQVRLLTFNTLFKGDVTARLRALGSILAQSDYDLVCLQEVMYRRHFHLLRDAFAPGVASGAIVLKGGLVILSRWPLLGSGFVRFARTGPLRPEYLMRKGVLLARVALPGGEVTIANTHLSADPAHARVELELLRTSLPAAGPLIVAGDFNLPAPRLPGLTALLAGPTYREPPLTLDHVLVRGLTGTARVVLTDPVAPVGYLSDHYGVDAELA
jgi:endonuclease/exonuclease/phosphatase family metal-dependent hydrolase